MLLRLDFGVSKMNKSYCKLFGGGYFIGWMYSYKGRMGEEISPSFDTVQEAIEDAENFRYDVIMENEKVRQVVSSNSIRNLHIDSSRYSEFVK
jgi:hypothetical protein